MIAGAPEEVRDLFTKRVKLMAPLLKAWKTALKDENAVDFSGLIHQAINILDKGRFVSPWKHILVDEFQDISPQRASLLAALFKADYAAQIANARQEAQQIVEKAVQQAEATTREQLAAAREQIEREKERARQDIVNERDRAMNNLRNEVISLSVAMATKVVAKDMDSETNTKLIEDAIAKLDSKTIGL